MDDPSAQDRKIWTIIAIIMTILTVLLFFFTVVLIPRLKIAIACLKVKFFPCFIVRVGNPYAPEG